MKLLSVVVPCFNSQDYLRQCLDSLLVGAEEELDVIVVNDGSTDLTAEIAHGYAKAHPCIRVVDKENGGHGSAVNVGLSLAEGLYFKILDSDDALDKDGLLRLLDVIKKQHGQGRDPDLYLAEYRSYNEGDCRPRARLSFRKSFKAVGKTVGWESLPRIRIHDFFMIHMVYVRTALLRQIDAPLLEKTFYEDNQFMFYVVKNTKTLHCLDFPIYKYSVGKESQSTSVTNMAARYEHQYRVAGAVLSHINGEEYRGKGKFLRWHIRHELFKIGLLIWFYTYIGKGRQRHLRYKEFYREFAQTNPEMHSIWKYKTPSFLLWMWPPLLRHGVAMAGYAVFAKRKGWK